MIDANKILFRCSSLGDIMKEPRSKSESISETAKTLCKAMIRELKYNRHKEIISKYMEKGTMVEPECIAMYSELRGFQMTKNETHFNNEFIKGTPDICLGDADKETGEFFIEEVYDIKSSWDLFTLPFPSDTLDKDYFFQLQGYLALTGGKKAKVVYCLANTPGIIITQEKNYLLKKLQGRENIEEIFPQLSEDLEKNMIFDDIPINERIIEFSIDRDENVINGIYDKVLKCREYIKTIL